MCEISQLFPVHMRQNIREMPWQGLEEIRIRIGQPLEFCYGEGYRYLSVGEESGELYRIQGEDLAEMLDYISNYSLYAYQEEVKQGYITIEGGHRIGLIGQAVTEQGKITGIHPITFLNFRIAHERIDCAKELLPYLLEGNSIYNTLFLSAPGAGKTTYLRDCIRLLSKGEGERAGMKVCVVDERSEIAACHMGVPQNDLGPRTDVLDGCGKTEGMLLLLRSMSPQVIAVDELGTEEDFLAVEQTVCSGSRILGTIHAGELQELEEKPHLRYWMEKQMFQRFVQIRRQKNGEREIHIFDAGMRRLC
ncbi:MAG: stage III sporulation protein AA [Clostridiales bacterium]|nr:stage III sporulation protein AA [Clostridiales bacterium]